mmetsp:Transcript_29977/g.73012  ORF Transcript_29977/g.73012 Transcript_29977/m.73012 type:complete len:355 (-) Transcript_29977:102-1166(-)
MPRAMSASTRCLLSALISGPRSAPSVMPADTTRRSARGTSSLIHSCASPTNTAVVSAMQRWPAAPNAAPTSASSVFSLLASGSTTAWFFAAMFACTRFRLRDARSWMYSPIVFEPTNDMAFTAGWSHRKSTESLVPWMTLNTPGGRPASAASLATITAAPGSFSLGFSTNVLPHTAASGAIHIGIIAGKLNGATPAHTPSGALYEYVSMLRDTSPSVSPISSVPTEHACSTTSTPRCTLPRASTRVLPCSSTTLCASSSAFSLTSACRRSMTRMRSGTGVLRHDSNAVSAERTARSISAGVASGTWLSSSCVAGFSSSTYSVDSLVTSSLSMNNGVVRAGVRAALAAARRAAPR